ncbi:MAG: phosphotransferase [Gammaproteobacteria bacterium]|nr:phosphotransferase [Gammaproteobacteria bacterium]
MNPEKRYQLLKRWAIETLDSSQIEINPINSDASFRNYYRVSDHSGTTYVIMDSPPDKENNEQFIFISELLTKMEIPSTVVYAKDLSMGFFILSDLGPATLLDRNMDTRIKTKREKLYTEAINILLLIQKNGNNFVDQLPVYDLELLETEMNLFLDWYCIKELGISAAQLNEFNLGKCFKYLSESALKQVQVFAHRDYHSRNIMISKRGELGIIDFQDAVLGPITYDLVSLLRDCYIELSENEIRHWLEVVYQRLINENLLHISYEKFEVDFDLMGCQRHLKAIGIFSRLKHRDGKPNYMKDVPRTLGYLKKISKKYDVLEPLHNFVNSTHLQ